MDSVAPALRRLLVLLGIVFVLGAALLSLGWRQRNVVRTSANRDQAVTALLEKTDIAQRGTRYTLVGSFRYTTIEGQTYEHVTAELAEASTVPELSRLLDQYMPGQSVRVYYGAASPKELSMKPVIEKPKGTSTVAFVGALLLFISVLLSLCAAFHAWAITRGSAWVSDNALLLLFAGSVPLVVLFLRYCPF